MIISIIILNYKTKELTLSLLDSLFENYGKEIEENKIEIILVDNASNDNSIAAFKKSKYSSEIKFIENKKNFGFSKGNNIAAKKASGEYLLFVNSDTVTKDKGFIKMTEFLNENKKTAVAGGKLINKDGSDSAPARKFYNLVYVFFTLFFSWLVPDLRLSPKKISEVDWVSGAFMMIRREVFNKLGGFDENIFMYVEDMELCFRVKKLGYNIVFFPKSSLFHMEYGSSNRTFAIVNIYKGILYFYKKHGSPISYFIVKTMLIIKARLLVIIGKIINNKYLYNTYSQALKI